ncbi:hypothetical protein SDC9_67563 [bioreactor metagenome]|jgi:hypothetical protein|uniref:DUF2971 domain-containing protein n=1 Tax=bioreactor metagenome TaxID=1076179 RepID=A0A644XY11_9ZZZZ
MFKYYNNESYFLDVLKNKRLYFASFRQFNDPYEIFGFLKNTDDGKSYVDKKFKDKIKCCCFSLTNRNYLLWSHYGKSHRGFCIEFDFEECIQNSIKNNVHIVNYNGKKLYGFKVDYNSYELEVSFSKSNKILNLNQSIELVRHKFADWEYEKEYRFITEQSEPGFIEIPSESIKSITYGYNISDQRMKYLDKRIKRMGINLETRKLKLACNIGQLL